MKTTRLGMIVVLALAGSTLVQSRDESTRLVGKTGFSLDDFSGWLDITPTDFAKGERLVIGVGGTASAVVVRLLPKGFDPRKPDVIIAERATVRADRTVEVTLTSPYRNIVQLSVHAGPSPWNLFPLGAGNGPATLVRVDRARP